MIDTIVIESPFISLEIAEKVELFCIKNLGVEVDTGEILYSFTRGELEGSYDSRISLQVRTDKWEANLVSRNVKDKNGNITIEQRNIPIKVDCDPYIRVECSVHKAMVGHNVFGGPDDLQNSVKWLIQLLDGLLITSLPSWDQWTLYRVDFAEVYDLGSFEAVEEWFRGVNSCTFPRRQVNRYGVSGLYCAGSTTAVKFYHKGVEFAKHDRKRVSKWLKPKELDSLQFYANRLLRVEVEIKSRKLKSDFGDRSPLIGEVSAEYLSKIYEKEVSRLIRDSAEDSKMCRTAQAVEKRLYSMFTTDMAGRLLGTWYRLATLGEEFVKKSLPKPTFYRHRKLLLNSGISWIETDIILRDFTMIPCGFVPLQSDSRRVVEIHTKVCEALRKVA